MTNGLSRHFVRVLTGIALLVGATTAFAAVSATGDLPDRELRRHFVLKNHDGSGDFTVTTVRHISESSVSTNILMQTAEGTRFKYSSEYDYVHQQMIAEVRSVDDGEFFRRTIFGPFTVHTHSATMEQARANPELMDDKNARFELSSGGSSQITGTLDWWKDESTARQWRTQARQMVSPGFLNRIEELETIGVFRHPDLYDLDTAFLSILLYRTDCHSKDQLEAIPAAPDCDFDKRFGFDCTDKQRERAEKIQTPSAATKY